MKTQALKGSVYTSIYRGFGAHFVCMIINYVIFKRNS